MEEILLSIDYEKFRGTDLIWRPGMFAGVIGHIDSIRVVTGVRKSRLINDIKQFPIEGIDSLREKERQYSIQRERLTDSIKNESLPSEYRQMLTLKRASIDSSLERISESFFNKRDVHTFPLDRSELEIIYEFMRAADNGLREIHVSDSGHIIGEIWYNGKVYSFEKPISDNGMNTLNTESGNSFLIYETE